MVRLTCIGSPKMSIGGRRKSGLLHQSNNRFVENLDKGMRHRMHSDGDSKTGNLGRKISKPQIRFWELN